MKRLPKRLLTRRTATTLDTGGCEFRYTMTRVRDWLGETIEQRYEAMGIAAATLDELRRRVGELN